MRIIYPILWTLLLALSVTLWVVGIKPSWDTAIMLTLILTLDYWEDYIDNRRPITK